MGDGLGQLFDAEPVVQGDAEVVVERSRYRPGRGAGGQRGTPLTSSGVPRPSTRVPGRTALLEPV
ncbi:hypothetical protein [Streptomyces sp. NPDC047869]|uniref:hypothetical protein n=1 Tax=Streptomyces sp. NPDC047869 TaxID=3154709 RepID=UPI00345530AD